MKARSIYSTVCLLMASYFLLTQLSQAKWARMNQSQILEYSDLIVVAEFLGVTDEIDPKAGSLQVSELKVIQTIKGFQSKLVKVYGYDMRMCAPNYQFEETRGVQYLLFLRKHKDGFVVVNGKFGALRITGQEVDWFVDPEGFEWKRSATRVDVVIEEILKK